jgi:hypothetical protein
MDQLELDALLAAPPVVDSDNCVGLSSAEWDALVTTEVAPDTVAVCVDTGGKEEKSDALPVRLRDPASQRCTNRGLVNLGNSCYIAASFQLLSSLLGRKAVAAVKKGKFLPDSPLSVGLLWYLCTGRSMAVDNKRFSWDLGTYHELYSSSVCNLGRDRDHEFRQQGDAISIVDNLICMLLDSYQLEEVALGVVDGNIFT